MGKAIRWELCKKLKFDYTKEWYLHNAVFVLEMETHKLLWNFEIQLNHLISAGRPVNKKENLPNSELCRKSKNIESEKREKYPDLDREQKKLWNMNVTVIPIVNGALGTIPKGLVKGLEELETRGQVDAIQTTALSRSARILRRVLETWEYLLSLKLLWKSYSWRCS